MQALSCTDMRKGFVHLRPMEIGILTDEDYRRAVGARLRSLINALGITYVEAAADMDVTKNHLGNWMRGTAYPLHYHLYRFCRIRGVNTDFIYLDDPSGLPGRVVAALVQGSPIPETVLEAEKLVIAKPRRKLVKAK